MTGLSARSLPPAVVQAYFTLTTCAGEGVPNVSADAFSIYEDGDPISTYESEQQIVPSSLGYDIVTILLLDLSGSVVKSGNLTNLRNSASAFSNTVGAGQFIGIYGFDGREELVVLADITNDPDTLAAGLETLDDYEVVDSSTNLNGAVLAGLTALDNRSFSANGHEFSGSLVVFTDGTDQAGRVSDSTAVSRVARSEHAVFSIGLAGEVDEFHLSGIGKDGYWNASDISALDAAFITAASAVVDLANSLYILAYCSPKRSGTHEVEVAAGDASLIIQFNAAGFEGGCSPADFQ